jgi:CheY-like chemotaxis protein
MDSQPQDQSAAQNGKRVLCIEDEGFISELYNRALTRGGYEAEFVTDGQS